jgi:hypothetical protein
VNQTREKGSGTMVTEKEQTPRDLYLASLRELTEEYGEDYAFLTAATTMVRAVHAPVWVASLNDWPIIIPSRRY